MWCQGHRERRSKKTRPQKIEQTVFSHMLVIPMAISKQVNTTQKFGDSSVTVCRVRNHLRCQVAGHPESTIRDYRRGQVLPGVARGFASMHSWQKHWKSPLSAVAPGTEGVCLLVPSGLSYHPLEASSRSLRALNSPGTKQLVRGRRGRLASGMS